MKRMFRALATALPLLLVGCLAGCVPAPGIRQPGDAALMSEQQAREQHLRGSHDWTLQGKLGISDGKDGGSGTLTWTQAGEHYNFVVRGPITGKSFRLSGGPDGAVLEGLDGGPRRGVDAETLMQQALGWDVPLGDLRAWVLGLRADSGPAELSFGADRLPSLLKQHGWVVDYRRWDAARQPPMPQIIFADKPPYKVRLAIESWTFGK